MNTMLTVHALGILLVLGLGTPVLAGGLTDAALQNLIYAWPNDKLQELSKVSDTEGSLSRHFFRPSHRKAAEKIRVWMESAGMEVWDDAVGNVHGRINGSDPDAKVLLIGSHYDTVADAGLYDGAMGIIVGVAAVKATVLDAAGATGVLSGEQVTEASSSEDGAARLLQGKLHGVLKRPVQVVAFSEEEGIRFRSPFLGSRALAGSAVRLGMLDILDADGMSVRQVLQEHGFDASEAGLAAATLDPARLAGYVEVHLEQGPVLEELGVPLGAVAAITGMTRLKVEVAGFQGHAGTVPMPLRKDALAAAAECISWAERRCGGGRYGDAAGPPEGVSEEDALVCTTGVLTVWPGASNVIASGANFSLDIRSQHDPVREYIVAEVVQGIEEICSRRGVSCSVHREFDAPAVKCAKSIVEGLTKAARDSQTVLGESFASHLSPKCSSSAAAEEERTCPAGSVGNPPTVVSGAGHDGMPLSDIVPVGMLFVRCRGGVSHSPLEHVSEADVAAATAALHFYLREELNG